MRWKWPWRETGEVRRLQDILKREGLSAPDGRHLFAYGVTDSERLVMKQMLCADGLSNGAIFTLWATEEIRVFHQPGHLKWEWLGQKLGRRLDPQRARQLVEQGLNFWRRPVRQTENGPQQYLYSLLAEGGLPDAYLREAVTYRGVLLKALGEIEAGQVSSEQAARQILLRHAAYLPRIFLNTDDFHLLLKLVLALAQLRATLPQDFPADRAEEWLSREHPDWRRELPVRLSEEALVSLIRPMLRAERAAAPATREALCWRELRWRADGTGWEAYAVIGRSPLLPRAFLPDFDANRRLRLFAVSAADRSKIVFLGVPEPDGWRLTRVDQDGEASMRLGLAQPLVLSAHVDGFPLGDCVIDEGQPLDPHTPQVWRAVDAADAAALALRRVIGEARTRAEHLWLLVASDIVPAAGQGVQIGEAQRAGDGMLWRLTGQGHVQAGGERLQFTTGAPSESALHVLHLVGRILPGWMGERGQRLYLGQPQLWGGEAGRALARLSRGVEFLRQPKRLCGWVARWTRTGCAQVVQPFFALPADGRLELREPSAGTLILSAEGLESGAHLRLQAGDSLQTGEADPAGKARLKLTAQGEVPARVWLTLYEPKRGSTLTLQAPWPARHGMIVSERNERLAGNRHIRVEMLRSWLAIVPATRTGRLMVRLDAAGMWLGMIISGETGLGFVEPLARLLLGLGGPDAELHLSLEVEGIQSPRLIVKRYNIGMPISGNSFTPEGHRWQLRALPLDPPGLPLEQPDAAEEFALCDWLGRDGRLWLIQANAPDGTMVRPVAWAMPVRPRSRRADRINAYAGIWQTMLGQPEAPAWIDSWALIEQARIGGDAGALDQVQALQAEPAAAIALLFRVQAHELSAALALQGAAPLWWPAVPLAAWRRGVGHALTWRLNRLSTLGYNETSTKNLAFEAIARRAGAILLRCPELQAHLYAAFEGCKISPCVAVGDHFPGGYLPLSLPDPGSRLELQAQALARHDPVLPHGLRPLRLPAFSIADRFSEHLSALLDAPMTLAAMVCGQPMPTDSNLVSQLILLRQAAPEWFDAALPAAIQLHIEASPQ
ncbi:STY4851/ECs_5259 family protein [Acidocella facilis]|uniref:STY4851/ECs_5259 family protein n=1 Tax=Acidocella facilis TaxID=525 RepID=UPI001F4511EB|nr:STY4851/ECs_5259 family protein [Acidocella facilis]